MSGVEERRKDEGGRRNFGEAEGRNLDEAQGGLPAEDDQTPPEEMDPQAVSPRQRLALEAFCKGGTIGDAARAANVSRQTLHRWRAKYPHFALAMSSWSSACLSTAESQLAEMASRAVAALGNAIDKGDARSAMAVLRSLGILRTYQPSKAGAAREQVNGRAGEQGMNFLAQAGASREQLNSGAGEQAAAREQENSRAGEQGKEATTSRRHAAAKPEASETRRTGSDPADVLLNKNVTSPPAKSQKPAILAGKAGSAIKRACDNALHDVTECYQMLQGSV
jgi:hypothetical protein